MIKLRTMRLVFAITVVKYKLPVAENVALGAELGQSFGEALTGGVSDGSWTAWRGIPTLDGLGPVGGDDHSPDEYVETASFAPRCGVVAGLVAAIDEGLLAL